MPLTRTAHTLPDAALTGSSRCLVHYRHRMETRNCEERVPDEDFTEQGRDDRRRSRQDRAYVTKVEAPGLAVASVDPRYEVSYLRRSARPCAPSLRRAGSARLTPAPVGPPTAVGFARPQRADALASCLAASAIRSRLKAASSIVWRAAITSVRAKGSSAPSERLSRSLGRFRRRLDIGEHATDIVRLRVLGERGSNPILSSIVDAIAPSSKRWRRAPLLGSSRLPKSSRHW